MKYVIWKHPDADYPEAMNPAGTEASKIHREEGLVIIREFHADSWKEAVSFHQGYLEGYIDSHKEQCD